MAIVLVVDDDPEALEILVDVLRRANHQVETVSSGEAALAYVRAQVPDLVVMDLKLPGINGIQALRAMKAIVPDVRAIMVTGFLAEALVDEVWSIDPIAVLPKPVDLDHLLTLVARATTER
ncbi:MAG: response regulator [Candidatus Rokubacteria bacterium]|nr:response regulator [Candidatus Rokubacteria bacterium]